MLTWSDDELARMSRTGDGIRQQLPSRLTPLLLESGHLPCCRHTNVLQVTHQSTSAVCTALASMFEIGHCFVYAAQREPDLPQPAGYGCGRVADQHLVCVTSCKDDELQKLAAS